VAVFLHENVKAKIPTQAQKKRILQEILSMMHWLHDNGNDLQNVMIVGHYHFRMIKPNNYWSWERIKECPSFDAYKEYEDLMLKENVMYLN
jgi:N-acetylmuramoyl-L-alanine amidase